MKVKTSFYIDKELLEQVRDFASANRVTISELFDKAIRNFVPKTFEALIVKGADGRIITTITSGPTISQMNLNSDLSEPRKEA